MGEPNWDALPDEFKGPVQKLRQAAGEGAVAIITNGRSPRHWSVERWLLVIGAVAGAIAASVQVTFMLGGEYRAGKDTIASLSRNVAVLTEAVDALTPQLLEMRLEQRGVVRQIELLESFHGLTPRTAAQSPAQSERASPAFPREEQFHARPAASAGAEAQP